MSEHPVEPRHESEKPNSGRIPLGFFQVHNDEDMEFAIEQLLAALERSGVKFKDETEEE